MNNKKLSDKESLLLFLGEHDGSFEELILSFIALHATEFPASRLSYFINDINTELLTPKIVASEFANNIALERATYLKNYLEGNLYTSREAAEQNIPAQINNAKAIIEGCKSARNI